MGVGVLFLGWELLYTSSTTTRVFSHLGNIFSSRSCLHIVHSSGISLFRWVMKTKVSQVLGTWILIRVATKKGIESWTQISGLQGIYRWGEVSELAVGYTVFSMLVKRYSLPYLRLFCLQFDDDYCSGLGCTTLIVCVLLKDETYLCGYWRLVINGFGAMMKITDGFKS